MKNRLVRRVAVLLLVLAAVVIGWRAGIAMGWWNASGCVNSRDVERAPDGSVVAIKVRRCAR